MTFRNRIVFVDMFVMCMTNHPGRLVDGSNVARITSVARATVSLRRRITINSIVLILFLPIERVYLRHGCREYWYDFGAAASSQRAECAAFIGPGDGVAEAKGGAAGGEGGAGGGHVVHEEVSGAEEIERAGNADHGVFVATETGETALAADT